MNMETDTVSKSYEILEKIPDGITILLVAQKILANPDEFPMNDAPPRVLLDAYVKELGLDPKQMSSHEYSTLAKKVFALFDTDYPFLQLIGSLTFGRFVLTPIGIQILDHLATQDSQQPETE